jgi:glutaredoxin 3
MVDWKSYLGKGKVVFFNMKGCPYCSNLKNLLDSYEIPHTVVETDTWDEASVERLAYDTGHDTFPNTFIGTTHVKGFSDVIDLLNKDKLFPLLQQNGVPFNK